MPLFQKKMAQAQKKRPNAFEAKIKEYKTHKKKMHKNLKIWPLVGLEGEYWRIIFTLDKIKRSIIHIRWEP